MTTLSTKIEDGDPFPGEEGAEYYATATITLAGDHTVTFLIQRSLIFPNTINVEVDGNFGGGSSPSLRVHMNDVLIVDTEQGVPEIDDQREVPDHDPDPDD